MRTRTERDVWRTACRVSSAPGSGNLRRWLLPLDFVRIRELPLVVDLIDVPALPVAARVLDLASPQMLSVHLGRQQPDWNITYLNPFAPEREEMARCLAGARLKNIVLRRGDARDAALFNAASFDLIVSCSVLEHVTDLPAGPGDAVVMRNIARWLRPGGQAIFSVPFSRSGFDEFGESAVYGEQTSARSRGRVFFQRFYDAGSLAARLLDPSGMAVEQRRFLGERYFHEDDIHQRLAPWLARRKIRFLAGRFYPWLARIFLEEANDPASLRKPYIAAARLRR